MTLQSNVLMLSEFDTSQVRSERLSTCLFLKICLSFRSSEQLKTVHPPNTALGAIILVFSLYYHQTWDIRYKGS